MITGNITKHSKPSCQDLKTGICSSCLEEVEEVPIDNSYDDNFGTIEDWGTGSPCCEAEVLEGSIFLDKLSHHVAKKDHVDEKGYTIVKKGQRYQSRIVKGYYIDCGHHKAIFNITKKVI